MLSHMGNNTCMTQTCVALETKIDYFLMVVVGYIDKLDIELTTRISVLSSTSPLVTILVIASTKTIVDYTAPIASITIDAIGTI